MVFSVLVVLAVSFIVFFIIGNQIMQSETIVSRDEINACIGPPPGGLIQIRTTTESITIFTKCFVLSTPEISDTVPVLAIPFSPLRRKVADLVATLTEVPRLCDKLHPTNY